jgi:hypothetical protein
MNDKNPVGRPYKWKEQTELKRFHRFLPLKAMPEILKAIDVICKTYKNDKI